MKKLILGLAAVVAFAGSAMAQANPKAINTGGAEGVYHSTFCPPIPMALSKAYFQGYTCTTSAGTLENIQRVSQNPTNLGFGQLDALARAILANPDLAKRLTVIRQDIAREGLWMITKNDRLQNFGDVLGFARRIPFVLPPEASGSAASFDFLKSIDPEGLGRATNIRHVANATEVINTIANSTDGSVGFFVQFADPDNANIKLMVEKGLRIIPVISREILRAKVGETAVYEACAFNLTGGGLFRQAREVNTACTPVVLFTGNPETATNRNAMDDQRELIQRVREIPAQNLLPADSRIAALITSVRRMANTAAEEAAAAVEAARQAANRQFGN